MKRVLHISTECYPAAKSGGLGDVVGALPIYQTKAKIEASVIIPKYDLAWYQNRKFISKHKGTLQMGEVPYDFEVFKSKQDKLPYSFYCIDIPGLFDRPSIYLDTDGEGFKDEPTRNIAFQRAVLQWLLVKKKEFDLLHCHDHQVGLIPFMIRYVPEFKKLEYTATVFTIHNAQYKGLFSWTDQYLLPDYDRTLNGWLDWDNCIHSLAAGVKLADKVTTVSPSYLEEITHHSGSLEYLFKSEAHKCIGILNGIDTEVWNPKTDPFLEHKRTNRWEIFKSRNKNSLCKQYGLSPEFPLIGFIGRLALEKGADLLHYAIEQVISKNKKVGFIFLGSGDRQMEMALENLEKSYPGKVKSLIMYNEGIAHQIYAACDYLLMPSRFEPCGLNQMYAMRYGTIPIVRSTGGLKDTVPDFTHGGNGISYSESNAPALGIAIERALALFGREEEFKNLRKKIIALDYSWEHSAKLYASLYKEIW